MKYFTYIVLLSIVSSISNAQSINKDSTISFQVSGVCVQCKHRIEKSLKIKGVETGLLFVVILGTSIIMSLGLLVSKREKHVKVNKACCECLTSERNSNASILIPINNISAANVRFII